jgi:AraC family transcriptional regulator
LEGLGRSLAIELQKEDLASSLAAESLALEILASVARSGPVREDGAPPWLSRVVEWIECEMGSPLGLSSLAKVAEVSPSRLSRAIRERFGMNLGTYVRERRLARARDLVLRSRQPLVDIAVLTGFFDQSHFSKAFKSRYGCTPSALRE